MEQKKGFLESVSSVFSKSMSKPVKNAKDNPNNSQHDESQPKKDYLAIFKQECHPNNYFFVHDGSAIRSIAEFRKILVTMPDSIFNYHVTQEKNDFLNWIKYVFNNEELADYLKDIKDKQRTIIALDAYFRAYVKEKSFLDKVEEAEKIAEKKELEEALVKDNFANKKHYHYIDEVNYDEVRDYLINRHNEIESKLSEIRKKGTNTRLAEVILINFKPKLHMFEATRSIEDKDKVEQLLEDAKKELLEEMNRVAV